MTEAIWPANDSLSQRIKMIGCESANGMIGSEIIFVMNEIPECRT